LGLSSSQPFFEPLAPFQSRILTLIEKAYQLSTIIHRDVLTSELRVTLGPLHLGSRCSSTDVQLEWDKCGGGLADGDRVIGYAALGLRRQVMKDVVRNGVVQQPAGTGVVSKLEESWLLRPKVFGEGLLRDANVQYPN